MGDLAVDRLIVLRGNIMKTKLIGIGIAAILIFGGIGRAAEGLPGGKWWNRPEVVKKLALTKEQRSKLDNIFRASAPSLIDLKGEVEKRAIDLRAQLDQEELNRQAIQTAANRLNESRGKLFERELMMLVDMRGVLTAEQWSEFRDTLEGPNGMGRRGGPGEPPPPEDRPRRPRM